MPGHRPHYPPLTGCNGRWEKAETDRRRRGKREKVRGGTVGTDTGNGKSPVTPKDFNDKKKDRAKNKRRKRRSYSFAFTP